MSAPDAWQRWDVHPSVAVGLVLLGGLYVLLGGLAAPRRRVAAFAGSLCVLLGALNGPLHELSDRYLFSAHMGQHLVLTLLFPPLFLYGLPAGVVRRVIRPGWLRALQGKLGSEHAITVEIAGLYWHFVDVVWIVIFTFVYLLHK